MRRITQARSKRRIAFTCAVALSSGVAAGVVAVAATGNSSPEPRPSIGLMPGDVDGDGAISDSGAERIPELISAVSDDGIQGYVRLSDLEGPLPQSPEEALKLAAEVTVIPVFAADGRTVVGQLTESGRVEERVADGN